MGCAAETRRDFLQKLGIGAGTALTAGLPLSARESESRRPRVAAIFTVLRFRSHAFNILENFLGPYYFNGELTDPGVDVVAMYADQFPSDDMARRVVSGFLCLAVSVMHCASGGVTLPWTLCCRSESTATTRTTIAASTSIPVSASLTNR
ncbi:MAG: twin-arginine translocation signal domain-containing protein [Planctomycetota bacterium]|jgi:hypothetical protein